MIGLFLIVLAALVLITTYTISAWLTDTKTTGKTTFTIGQVVYTWSGSLKEFDENEHIVPGQELVDEPFALTNASTVSSELRFKFTSTINADPVITDAREYLLTAFDEDWYYNTSDDYYYYRGDISPVTEDEVEKYKIPANDQELSVLTSLKLDGSKVGNDFRLLNLTIEMVFEAKQSDYVTWQQLGTIHFSTGLAQED
jgi:hypothetical protein